MRISTILLFAVLFLSLTLFTNDSEKFRANEEVLSQIFRDIDAYYVDETNPDEIQRTAIDAVLKSLDPYSYFISEAEQEARSQAWKGVAYSGIGIQFIMKEDIGPMITEITEGYPAHKAGLIYGDVILAANETSLKNISLDSSLKILRGAKGSELHLQIDRRKQEFGVNLIREEIRSKAVKYAEKLDERTGYILFAHFLEGSGEELKEHVLRLKKEGVQQLILDMRGNSGGLVVEAVKAANIFLSKGKNIVRFKGRAKEWNTDNPCHEAATDTLIPLVVLIDQSSISAAEIFAGAMQDYDRAILLGRRSFGKGLVQGTRFLPHGNSIYMSSAKYYTPSGRCIQELDYRKKDKEARPEKIHAMDSIHFKTQNGRTVKANGGITPDVLSELTPASSMLQSLQNAGLIRDFVFEKQFDESKYKAIESKLLSQFKSYVVQSKKQIQFKEDETFEAFIRNIKEQGRYEASKIEIEKLKNQLQDQKIVEIEKHSDEILRAIRLEMAWQNGNLKNKIRVSLVNDEDVIKSKIFLADTILFAKTLNVKN